MRNVLIGTCTCTGPMGHAAGGGVVQPAALDDAGCVNPTGPRRLTS